MYLSCHLSRESILLHLLTRSQNDFFFHKISSFRSFNQKVKDGCYFIISNLFLFFIILFQDVGIESMSRYISPVNPNIYPHLTLILLGIGIFFTAWFFVYLFRNVKILMLDSSLN